MSKKLQIVFNSCSNTMLKVQFLLLFFVVLSSLFQGNLGELHLQRDNPWRRSLQQDMKMEASTTGSSCKCLDPWYFNGQRFDGVCANPSNQILGVYCYVDESTCEYPPFSRRGVTFPTRGAYDYCHPATGKTLSGCECEHEWGYGGERFPGTCGNPNNDPNGRWCEVNPYTCKEEPKKTKEGVSWDYCEGNPNATYEDLGTETTNAGCSCLLISYFRGRAFANCSNPDNDAAGPWCSIDIRTCESLPYGRKRRDMWDFCTASDTKTIAGCRCQPKWQIFDGINVDIQEFTGQCANPDNDPNGEYCVVDELTCEQEPAGKVESQNMSFDYCQKPTTDIYKADVDITNSGCRCRPGAIYEFNQTSYTFDGKCSNPGDEDIGPWCIVDAKTCKLEPIGDTPTRDKNVLEYWDYCMPPLPPTQAGCQCKAKWSFPPYLPDSQEFPNVCGNPNKDPNGNICEIIPNSCSRGLAKYELLSVLGIRQYDYCAPNAPTLSTIGGDLQQSDCLTMLEQLRRLSQYKYLLKALEITQLNNIVNNQNINLTLFAPQDYAFQIWLTSGGFQSLEGKAKDDSQLLKQVILNHIVGNEKIKQEELQGSVDTLARTPLQIEVKDNGGVLVRSGANNEAQIVEELIDTCNGAIYPIDSVLTVR